MTKTNSHQKLLSVLRWIATVIALFYLVAFIANFFWRRPGNEISLDVEWGIPDNPKFVIALALICGASAVWLFRDVGKLISTLLSITLISYEVWQWFDLTLSIKSNAGVSTFPRASWIGNHLIGSSLVDVIGLIGAAVLLVFSIGRFLTSDDIRSHYGQGLGALSRR
jgi:hypothetical protein